MTRTLPGETQTSFVTAPTPSCTIPIGPVTAPPTITVTRTLPGATFTSFYTAPGFNQSIIYTSVVTSVLPGPTITSTISGAGATLTEYETRTLPGATFTAPGGSFTLTEYATKTLPGSVSTITSIVNQPGEDSTITTTETTTYYETISTCDASPTGPIPPPRETTIYATNYITKTIPTTYTADATCSDSTITITATSGGWDKPGGYGPGSSSSDGWEDKPSSYGSDWTDKPSGYGGPDAAPTKSDDSWKRA